ncbi:DUF2889 domain-containing protein [Paraburkholderia unamae]|uniref:DUF2889 family protein n=1 Tax=Paraburkholderia unamae TaxID=219649 RepID=A0ABX5KNY5_9BURK|nr:DUF2889 domain-containing protein [Paraburkholderia unamae]PVX82945.1 hypothetical protein C7402_108318 [Paraburkholderia unamae]CAG9268867.1 conserved hypothetical protein [Paraburkholderia unamae]
MPFTSQRVARERLHTRRIHIEGFRRADGLWDIEGHLLDTKDQDLHLFPEVRRAGDAVHSMRLRWTLDSTLTIVSAEVVMDAVPYAGVCNAIQARYQKLAGLRVGAGFRRAVSERFKAHRGCSHITELVGAMAAGSIQTLAPYLNKRPDARPVQIGGCHAWRESGTLVETIYPQWYVSESSNEVADQLSD